MAKVQVDAQMRRVARPQDICPRELLALAMDGTFRAHDLVQSLLDHVEQRP